MKNLELEPGESNIDFCPGFRSVTGKQALKMIFAYLLFPIFSYICTAKAAVFLWSNKKVEISPLQTFTKEQFSNLTKELDNPEVYYFRSSRISPNIRDIIDGYYSAFVPNGDFNIEGSIGKIYINQINTNKK